jgi:PTS system mannitol-specific IIA component/PTS system ascorbate-specific IIA component
MVIKVLESVSNYEEAIKLSCDILQERNSIRDTYFDSIISKINEYGPYFCIAHKTAMPHARPEDGAIENDLCLLKLNNPVDFLGKEVQLFLTLSSKDKNSHLDLMKKVVSICSDDNKLNKILNSKNEEEIMEVV